MADRRRINGPVGTTAPPVYDTPHGKRIVARSGDNAVRKICEFSFPSFAFSVS